MVLKFRSVNNIVIAPAKTGNESNNSTAVTKIDQTNKGILCKVIPGARIFIMVVIKFAAPRIEDAPAKCKLKIAKSTDGPLCACTLLNGGYTVQPVPAPDSTIDENSKKISAGGNNQNEILFNRGKAISGAPIIMGTNQLPNPPIIVGITKKKIIIKACAVTITLYNCLFPAKIWTPGCANSARIKTDKLVPITAEIAPKIKYKEPINLWLHEKSQLEDQLYNEIGIIFLYINLI